MELCPAPTLPRQEILSLSPGRCKGWGDRESPPRGGLRGRGGLVAMRSLPWYSDGSRVSRSAMADSARPHGLQPARLLRPWGSPGKDTGVGCHALLQGIFPTQRVNLLLLGPQRRQAGSLLAPSGRQFFNGIMFTGVIGPECYEVI